MKGLSAQGLFVMGGFHEGRGTTLLLGAGPGLWPVFTAAPEHADGAPDPLDRWSKRVIGARAAAMGARATYPSDGPPYAPFTDWALRTGRFWRSPVGMLVHDVAGLMISIRGALHLPARAELPAPQGANPCPACPAPCRTACPVDALKGETYDVAACKDHLRRPAGADCREAGCRARRACPVSRAFGRDPAQSAFHMEAFLWA